MDCSSSRRKTLLVAGHGYKYIYSTSRPAIGKTPDIQVQFTQAYGLLRSLHMVCLLSTQWWAPCASCSYSAHFKPHTESQWPTEKQRLTHESENHGPFLSQLTYYGKENKEKSRAKVTILHGTINMRCEFARAGISLH